MQKKKKNKLKAFILAAGYGSRLGELTENIPKPLVPIMGIPLLFHLLKQLEEAGIEEVALNTYYKKEKIKKALEAYSGKLVITVLEEEILLGTGGGLANTKTWCGDADLLVLNSDLLHTISLQNLIKEYQKDPRHLLFALCEPAHPGKTLLWCQEGALKAFREKTSSQQSPYSFACLHIIPNSLLRSLPEKKENYGIMPIYERLLKEGELIRIYSTKGAFWLDIGTPRDYLEGQLHFYQKMKEGKQLEHPAFSNPKASMEGFEKTLEELKKNYPGFIETPLTL